MHLHSPVFTDDETGLGRGKDGGEINLREQDLTKLTDQSTS